MLNKNLKQRLVGILVLVALAVIFIPVLFDFEPRQPIDTATQIPPAPEIQPVEMAEPEIPDVDNDVVPPDEIFDLAHADEEEAPEPNAEVVAEPQPKSGLAEAPKEDVAVPEETPRAVAPESSKPRLAENGLPEAWVVQVASYPEKAKAEALSSRLQTAGFRAFVRPVKVNQGTYHRVYVGPHILKKSAEEEKVKIDNSLDVNSLIIPFEP
jgi:DedD protein